MDLEIKFKNEQKAPPLLHLKNVDKLSNDELNDLKLICEHSLTSYLYSIIENENLRLHLSLEYVFLDKKDLLNRVFNGIAVVCDFDCSNKTYKKDVEATLKNRIGKTYKKTDEYYKYTHNTLEK